MAMIPLTKGKFAIVDDEDFDNVSGMAWHINNDGYAVHTPSRLSIPRRGPIRMHRFIVSAPLDMEVDHINGDRLDNRRINLRLCTRIENMQNQKPRINGTSKFKGVSWYARAGKWQARIRVNKSQIHLGYFDDETVAAQAYDVAALKHFGEFANTNF